MLKAKLKQQYNNLTDEDLNCSNGSKKTEMLENTQQKLGITYDQLYQIILKL